MQCMNDIEKRNNVEQAALETGNWRKATRGHDENLQTTKAGVSGS